MEKVDSLFFLIKSLSKAQKRYFKINTPHIIHGQNNYMKLFDSLEKQRDYDEAEIIKEFEGETFVKHLPSEKNYLYELILKTMRAYQNEKNTITKLKGMMHDIEFLHENSMTNQAYKKLRKAKKLAQSSEEFNYLLDILELEKNLAANNPNIDELETFQLIWQEEDQYSQLLNNERVFNRLYHRLKLISNYPNENNNSEIEEIVQHDILKDSSFATTFEGKKFYHMIYVLYHKLKNNLDAAKDEFNKLLAVWEENPTRKEEYSYEYKECLHEYAELLLELEESEAYSELMNEIKSNVSKNIRGEINDLKNYNFSEFQTYLDNGDFDRANAVLPEIDSKLTHFRYLIDPGDLVVFYFNIAVYHFIIDEPKKVSKWISKIKRLKTDSQMDVQIFSCFIEIMAHFNDRKETHMQYILRNNFQFINDRPKLTHFQQTIYKNIRKSLKLKTRDQIIDVLFKLRSEMLLYKEAKIESQIIGVDEMIYWIDSQIKDVNVKEVFLERVQETV